MLRASWKSLLGRKLRLFMSAFAIILGVSFVSGSFIFTDTLGRAFDGIVNTVGEVVVRPDLGEQRLRLGAARPRPCPGRLVQTSPACPTWPAPTATSPTRPPSWCPRRAS